MISCDKAEYGCEGGYLDRAHRFVQLYGIPTNECVPYTSGNTG